MVGEHIIKINCFATVTATVTYTSSFDSGKEYLCKGYPLNVLFLSCCREVSLLPCLMSSKVMNDESVILSLRKQCRARPTVRTPSETVCLNASNSRGERDNMLFII